MTMSQILAPHLPYLRRYARALTGSQSSGDAHVRAALTALLREIKYLSKGSLLVWASTGCSMPSGNQEPSITTNWPSPPALL